MFFNVLFYMGKMRTVCVCIAKNARWKTGVFWKISQRSYYVQHCPFTQKVAMHCMFNTKQFQAYFSTYFFTWEKCVQCAFAVQRMFYPKISKRSCYVQHFTCTQKVAMHSMFKTKELQACFSTFYFTWEKCVQCAFAVQRMFYPKISQWSCYVQHCTFTQRVAMHSIFNIKQFQECF